MQLIAESWLPAPRDRVFAFFSMAENLEAITPAWLCFRILSPLPVEMRAGTRIDYRISLHGVPLRWRSEISVWDPPCRFVDAQLRGPYRHWIHSHDFEDLRGGTLMRDRVDFAVPGGRLLFRFVARDLRAIFTYRHEALVGAMALPTTPPPEIRLSR